MARPTKNGEDLRASEIRVRLTAAEKVKILELAESAGLTPSDFLRKALLSLPPKRKRPDEQRTAFIKALGELGKVGSNVNQIARALNRKNNDDENPGVAKELIEYTMREVAALTTQLIGLLENNTDGHSRE